MIQAWVIQVEAKSVLGAEQKLGDEFNKWITENPKAHVIKFFEPVRKSQIYGDHNYNTYYASMTFFYTEVVIEIEMRTDWNVPKFGDL